MGRGHVDRLPELAADLVRRQVAVIAATGGSLPPLVAKAATTTIPVVFNSAGDPVRLSFVASLSRPGGNLTGTRTRSHRRGRCIARQPAGRARAPLPVRPPAVLIVVNAATTSEIDAAFASLVQQGAGGLLLSSGAFFLNRRDQIIALAARHALPAIYPTTTQVERLAAAWQQIKAAAIRRRGWEEQI